MLFLHVAFFRIMMLSVLRHTKTPIKFWFLKNYLSPSFKVHISSPDLVFAELNLFPGATSYPVSSLHNHPEDVFIAGYFGCV